MIDYAGKTILVTGGASGIGKALAEAFAARGARVIIADRQAEAAEAVAASLNGLAIRCDLSDPAAPAALIDAAWAWKDRLDFVCANAGTGVRNPVLKEDFGPATERLFAVNMHAPIRMAQAYAARLAEASARGRLMITSSENALSLPAGVRRSRIGAYAASKHGVLILAEWLREELAGETMDLHVLLPGAVYTPLVAAGVPDPALAPKELGLIMPERCAEIALKGLDLGLFYIPTHSHIAADMRPRTDGVRDALKALGLTS
ncbi:MAG: SDR family oxidoreductase [Hyphomonas sp.]|uniref:SDR family NAD(P)-dependent oxidoreductase n=1 Tax=Hyphomonas sp. TaxID=87 RepID=UPI0034A02407